MTPLVSRTGATLAMRNVPSFLLSVCNKLVPVQRVQCRLGSNAFHLVHSADILLAGLQASIWRTREAKSGDNRLIWSRLQIVVTLALIDLHRRQHQ